jgi:hypothetical protein
VTSYKKEDNVFTRNPLGGKPGESDGMIRKKIPGGTLLSAYPQDNVHGVDLPNCYDGEMPKGSVSDLGHSLKGASMVVDEYPRDGSSGKKEI